MTIVVSDTSPVRALANLGRLELLRLLYGEVVVPTAVADELRSPPTGQMAIELAAFPFIRVQAASDRSTVETFQVDLDRGESEALALALEIQADLILMDEASARAKAKPLGLPVIGVLGVLLEGKQQGLIDALAPLIDALQNDYRFYLTPRVRSEVLRLAGEAM